MFPQQPQEQFRTASADVKLFYTSSTWLKPPGVSHVYMMLIGGGGNGDTTSGGGSGAVTVWYGAAQHVPDSLVVSVSTGNNINTTVNYRASSGLIALLTANGATTVSSANAMTANQFTASGFFRSTAGQDGSTGNITASGTTFLSGGGGTGGSANYGYTVRTGNNGYFQMQPIIVGLGGASGIRMGGTGCGGGVTTTNVTFGQGGNGLVVIITW
jgi:hypothetical protein